MDTTRAAAARPPQPRQPVRGADGDRSAGPGCGGARAACRDASGRCRIGCSRSARATASPTSTIRSAPRRMRASRRWTCSAIAASRSWSAAMIAAWIGQAFADAMRTHAPAADRHHGRRTVRASIDAARAGRARRPDSRCDAADDLADAMRKAQRALGGRGRRAAVAGRAEFRRLSRLRRARSPFRRRWRVSIPTRSAPIPGSASPEPLHATLNAARRTLAASARRHRHETTADRRRLLLLSSLVSRAGIRRRCRPSRSNGSSASRPSAACWSTTTPARPSARAW